MVGTGQSGSEHPDREPQDTFLLSLMPFTCQRELAAKKKKKKEHMDRKQLSWAFPGLRVAQPPTVPHLGGSLVPGWGHGGFVTLVQAHGCSQDAPDTDAEPQLPCSALSSSA